MRATLHRRVDRGVTALASALSFALLTALAVPSIATGETAPATSPLPPTEASAEAGAAAPETTPLPQRRPAAGARAGPPVAPAEAPRPALPPKASPPAVAEPAAPAKPPSAHALQASPLPKPRPGLRDSTLIGIFALTTGRSALMRFPGGVIQRVTVGDTIGGWRVSSISNDRLSLTRGAENRTFMLLGN